jgi:hypothetical protein
VRDLDRDHEQFYPDFIFARLGEAARAALELLMTNPKREYESDFARKYFYQGVAQGEAQGQAAGEAVLLLKLLRFKGFTLTPELQARVEACRDIAQLDTWAERILHASSLADVFD